MKHTISSVLILMLSAIMAMAQNNTLTIPSVTSSPGQTISLPINLDNTADVVALQFTLTIADGLTLQPSKATLTERGEGLNVVMREMSNGKYMAMIFSTTNKAIIGRTGTLLTVPMVSASSLDEGSVLPMTLSDVVIGILDGTNVSSGFDAGSVTITKAPDLEVSNVATSATTIFPGEDISISWQVSNIGGQPTESGWSEQIYLESATGESKVLSTVYYDKPLNAGGVVARNATLILPEILGLDGNVHIRVKLTPNRTSGEPSWLLDNNAALSTSTISVGKKLSLTPEEINIEEKDANVAKLYISQSGSTLNDLSVNLESTDDTRVGIPSTIIIPKGQSGSYIYADLTANGELDNNQIVEINAICADYTPAEARIIIEDDTYPSLKLTSEKDEVNEGETITLIIEAERVPVEDLEIKLTCDFLNKFQIPSIIIPAGQKRVEAIVEAKDDDTPDVLQVVSFTASARGYLPDTYIVDLIDNDVPSLQLNLTPNAVSESAGPLSIVAKIQRTDNIDKRVTIKFSDDSEGNIYYGNQTVEMAPGVKEITTSLGPIDNNIVDGERTYNVSASVWIASCSCSATNGTSGDIVTVPVTIYDNDGPSLSLKSSASAIQEGGKLEITVSRNNDTSAPLDVLISTDHDSSFDFPTTVTIPAGETSVTFTMSSTGNDTTGDSFITVLTVECEGYAKANLWFMVTDQTLPDSQVSAVNVSKTEIEAGGTVEVSVTITNTGSYELPELTKIGFYIKSNNNPLTSAYLQTPLLPGESVTISKPVTMPNAVGVHTLYAVVNDGQGIKELLYSNNMSENVTVKTVSPFTISLKTDKDVYMPDEPVVVSGVVTGPNCQNHEIDVYFINSYRQTIKATTDENGVFEVTWVPSSQQCGHFDLGACYPGEKSDVELASIDVYGLIIETEFKGIESATGDVYTGSFKVKNPGSVPLKNVCLSNSGTSENYEFNFDDIELIENLPGNSSVDIPFSIRGLRPTDGQDFEKIELSAICDENIEASGLLYYYCYPQSGKVSSETTFINCTVTKDSYRDIPITISNIGKGETGTISLSIATPWITSVTPSQLGSLQQGEKATIVLRLKPENLQLNVQQTAKVGINCENGDGMIVNVVMEPVSEEIGHLVLDVCDQYTYNTTDAPHLAGAEIRITHPLDNKIIASGITGENGIFEVDLPEGYYGISVTANQHESYSNNILINPGKTDFKTIDLSYTGGISITYTVEPIEGGIEDSYQIVTTVEYETNVPVPVVILEGPTSIDAMSMSPGESIVLNYVATNKGMVTALDYHIVLPEICEDFSMIPLYDPTPRDIPANSSVAYPILFTRNPYYNSRRNAPMRTPVDDLNNNFNTCMTSIGQWYRDKCGTELRDNHGAIMLALKACGYGAIAGVVMDAISNIPAIWHPSLGNGWGGSSYSGGGGGTFIGVNPDRTICNPDVAEAGNDAINLALGAGLGPIAGAFDSGMNAAAEIAVDGHPSFPTIAGIGISALSPFTSEGFQMVSGAVSNLGQAAAWLLNHGDVMNIISNSEQHKQKRNLPNWMVYMGIVAQKHVEQLEAIITIQDEIFGDHYWIDHYDASMIPFINAFAELGASEISVDKLKDFKPESVSLDMLEIFLDRCRNTVNGIVSNNSPDYNKIIEAGHVLENISSYALENGYQSMEEMYRVELDKYMARYNEESTSVCSSISLQFKQKLVMTREAFRGTLTVFNGHDSNAMENIVLHLTVKDENGINVTEHEMTIANESTSNFETPSDSGWSLSPNETGIATILYIPTKYAALERPVDYDFGGSLTYTNPYNGLTVTETFTPITLTVHPSPNLDLTYFMQRDVIGDDPLTETVEPCEEAEFSLLINNLGYGDAENVKITTEQPKIIDNEKGLLIDFELMYSQLNGQDKTLALGGSVTTDFGTVPAKSSSYAQWWIKSSLLGHFTNYNVEATHLTSYDNPDLSLLNEVSIHELIRSIEIGNGESKLTGFMTNDIVDANDMPDMMYLSNGEIEPVSIATSAVIHKISDTDYSITIQPDAVGWNYGSISDPTYGMVKLNSVRRQSDGKEISLRNFWLTDRTLRDGKDPLYENRIHFVDDFSSLDSQTYILTFEPMPDILLQVDSFDGIPDDGVISPNHIEQVRVTFNKTIDASSFTSDDIMLRVQGENQDVSLIGISTNDNKTFVLDFTELNNITGNGYYVLTIQTSNITDNEGFTGKEGKTVAWTTYIDGLLLINTSVNPVDAGVISGDRNAQYGETSTLVANPNIGYEFSHWTVNGEIDSRNAEWNSVILDNMEVIANFVPLNYTVTVDTSVEGGKISGFGTGIYNYGDKITLNALADTDYEFQYWIVNGHQDANTLTLEFSVEDDIEISASFKYIGLYKLQLDMSKGWNWISHNFTPSLSLENFTNDENIVRILSQTQEAIRDPQLGIAGNLTELMPQECYKFETNASVSATLNGYTLFEPNTPIHIQSGWNWLGYPLSQTMSVDEAFAPTVAENLDVIVGQNGFAQFDGEKWIGTLETLSPGLGYMYNSQSEKTIVYNTPTVSTASARYVAGISQNLPLVLDIYKYASIMPIVATIQSFDGINLDNKDYQVNAYCGTECRGIGRIVNGLVMMNIYGNTNDKIIFQVTDNDGIVQFANNSSLSFSEQIVGNLNDPYVIAINSQSGISAVNYNGNIKVSIVGDMLMIKGIAADDIDLVEVYDIGGQKLIHETKVSESGIRVSNLNTGVYIVIVDGNGQYTYHRVALH